MYVLNDKMESILNNVYNIGKIHGIELMAAQYEYLLYQIYISNTATVEQLSEVINLSTKKLISALSNMATKGLVEVTKTLYYGETISVYSMTSKGIEFISGCFDFCEYEIKQRSFNKQINHFVEAGSLYFSIFNDSMNVRLTREETHFIGDKSILRPDAELIVEYDGFNEHFFIENDRGTELESRLKDKFNEKYGIYMLNENPVNLVFTVSRESLIKGRKAKDIAKDINVRMSTELVKILRATASVMSKLSIDIVDELYFSIDRYYSTDPDYKTYAIIHENIDNLLAFKLLNESLSLTSKDDVYNRMYQEDDIRKKMLEHTKELFLKRNTDYRIDVIKNIVLNMDETMKISESFYKTYSSLLTKHLLFEAGEMMIPSYRSLLEENELIIGSLFDVKWYFSKRTKYFKDVKAYFELLFEIKINSFEYSEIEFMVKDKKIKKRLNSGIANINGKRIALSILEPHINVSDQIKYDLFSNQEIIHSYDEIRFVILDKSRIRESSLIEYEDVISNRISYK